MRLGLDSPCPQYVHAARLLLGVGKQRGLSDPGFPHDGKHAAVAGASTLEQPDKRHLLMITAEQHVSEFREAPRYEATPPAFRTRGLTGSDGG